MNRNVFLCRQELQCCCTNVQDPKKVMGVSSTKVQLHHSLRHTEMKCSHYFTVYYKSQLAAQETCYVISHVHMYN